MELYQCRKMVMVSQVNTNDWSKKMNLKFIDKNQSEIIYGNCKSCKFSKCKRNV